MAERSRSDKWYGQGLRFRCMQCNACCGGAPGYVWMTPEEIERAAEFLGLPVSEFKGRYCRRVWWRTSLVEMPNGDCVFLGPGGCRIYPVRPQQCRTFPFWPDVVASPARWRAEKERCPGIGQGRLYTSEEIERIVDGDVDT